MFVQKILRKKLLINIYFPMLNTGVYILHIIKRPNILNNKVNGETYVYIYICDIGTKYKQCQVFDVNIFDK